MSDLSVRVNTQWIRNILVLSFQAFRFGSHRNHRFERALEFRNIPLLVEHDALHAFDHPVLL